MYPPLSDKEKVESAEFLLRNWQPTKLDDYAELIDELWWIVVEGKYKPEEGEDETV